MNQNNLTRLRIDIKEDDIADFDELSKKENNLYKLGRNHYEIINSRDSRNVQGRVNDYYDQFIGEPENAIRFITAKYIKEIKNNMSTHKTICERVLTTKFIENNKTKIGIKKRNWNRYFCKSGKRVS